MTVVIATRDRVRELCRTLARLEGLEPRPPVVVVDNGSSDGTAAAVRERFPGVRVLRRERNLGCAARNAGAARARTPYVAFCDDDSWWEPGSLEAAADALDAHPGWGLVTAAVRVGPQGRPDPVTEAQLRAPLPGGGAEPRVMGFLACAAVVRRSAFEEAGGFEPLLFFGGEEELLALDLAAAGWELRLLPGAVVRHHPSPHRPPGLRRAVLQERNALLTVWLRRRPAVVRDRTLRVAARCPADRVRRRALAAALYRLPAVLARRRRLPARVEEELEAAQRAA
ncbi:glycosyltransferase [Nocardiopsis sp. NPDC006139]|uniref:glycosyltransferase family 2 protein n=1 Tax=Nocardiopsis TaxID=2013 RepID=UPI0033B87139